MKMRKVFGLLTVAALALLFIFAAGSKMQQGKAADVVAKAAAVNSQVGLKPDVNFGKIPLYFISNKGQVDAKAKFYAKASRYTLWLTKKGLVFDSFKRTKSETTHPAPTGHPSQEGNIGFDRDVSRLMFIGANKNPQISAIEPAKVKVNYFIGNDKSKWRAVPTSMAVLYKSLYKNIDLKVYGIEKQIEYDWIVKPGANPSDIRFEYTNVKGTRIDKEGNLLIATEFGELMHKRPVSYQKIKASGSKAIRQEVDVTFKRVGKNTYGFSVGDYDKSRELVIDPVVLAYSTYLGGSDNEFLSQTEFYINVDSSGYAYVCGDTKSTDFPTLNQYQGTFQGGHTDVYVAKLDPTQSGAASLLYSTYLGGSARDDPQGLAIDGSGNIYVTGFTYSDDFPTKNPYPGVPAGNATFFAKLDPNQSGAASLLYCTHFWGGKGGGIAVDSSGYVYVGGTGTVPLVNEYQSKIGGGDAFVSKFDLTQTGTAQLIYSTQLGGSGYEDCMEIVADDSGCAYVTGITRSTNFPTLNPYQGTFQGGMYDVYISKIDTTQSGAACLLYSTYLGGSGRDWAYDLAIDAGGNIYVNGFTNSTNFPTMNAYQGTYQGGTLDAYVTKLDPSQSGTAQLLYSTYLGGVKEDRSYGIDTAPGGYVFVTGATYGAFPVLNQYQGPQGGRDVFVTCFDSTKSGAASLVYSTHLGGSNTDWGQGIAVDSSANVYVTGVTQSTDFPTLNQYQGDQGWTDAFVAKLSFGPTAGITVTSPNGGEEWALGAVENITWETTGSLADLKITLWKGGQLQGNIADGIDPGTNAYAWTVGQHSGGTAPEGTDYTIEIEEIGSDVMDSSDAPFTLFIPNEPPVAACKAIEKEADDNNVAYITPADVDGGCYDPDEGDEITLSLDNSGPFGIGAHTVELTVTDQHGASDSCTASVKVYANPAGISNYIQNLPADCFDKNAEQRKKTFKNKLDAVQELIDAANYQEAIDKLKNDIRKKVDGKNKNAWIIDPEAQAILTAYIDSMIEYLTGLL